MLIKIPNIHFDAFDAFKTRSSIVFMTFRFGDVNVFSKKRHVITQRRAVFKLRTEYPYALLLSKYKVFQTTNQNVCNLLSWNYTCMIYRYNNMVMVSS